MRTKKEIKEAIKNLREKPEKTGWGCGEENCMVGSYIGALKWVLEKPQEKKIKSRKNNS